MKSVLKQITDDLVRDVSALDFSPPVYCVYNPLEYARKPWDEYCSRFASDRKPVILVGMNPGPFGMAQIGVPFGEIAAVRDWMGIRKPVDSPRHEHPRRPVNGFECQRSEVSGRRLWGWAQSRWETPENFFSTFFVTNYCPLVFMEESGRNLTPNKITGESRSALFDACDTAIRKTVEYMRPDFVLGVGGFAEKRMKEILAGQDVTVGRILHPSPASPAANKGWDIQADKAVREIGIKVPEPGQSNLSGEK